MSDGISDGIADPFVRVSKPIPGRDPMAARCAIPQSVGPAPAGTAFPRGALGALLLQPDVLARARAAVIAAGVADMPPVTDDRSACGVLGEGMGRMYVDAASPHALENLAASTGPEEIEGIVADFLADFVATLLGRWREARGQKAMAAYRDAMYGGGDGEDADIRWKATEFTLRSTDGEWSTPDAMSSSIGPALPASFYRY